MNVSRTWSSRFDRAVTASRVLSARWHLRTSISAFMLNHRTHMHTWIVDTRTPQLFPQFPWHELALQRRRSEHRIEPQSQNAKRRCTRMAKRHKMVKKGYLTWLETFLHFSKLTSRSLTRHLPRFPGETRQDSTAAVFRTLQFSP